VLLAEDRHVRHVAAQRELLMRETHLDAQSPDSHAHVHECSVVTAHPPVYTGCAHSVGFGDIALAKVHAERILMPK
jgi:hypothetical protein